MVQSGQPDKTYAFCSDVFSECFNPRKRRLQIVKKQKEEKDQREQESCNRSTQPGCSLQYLICTVMSDCMQDFFDREKILVGYCQPTLKAFFFLQVCEFFFSRVIAMLNPSLFSPAQSSLRPSQTTVLIPDTSCNAGYLQPSCHKIEESGYSVVNINKELSFALK